MYDFGNLLDAVGEDAVGSQILPAGIGPVKFPDNPFQPPGFVGLLQAQPQPHDHCVWVIANSVRRDVPATNNLISGFLVGYTIILEPILMMVLSI